MELFLASLVNLAADCLWSSLLFCGFALGRASAPAAAESPLVAESNRDLADLVAGRTTFAEFTARNDARLATLKGKL